MKNDTHISDGRGSPDKKTRVEGNRVIHSSKGSVNRTALAESPRGLTAEEGEEERVGSKIGNREVREAAQGERQSSASGPISARQSTPGTAEHKAKTDEVTQARKGQGKKK